MFKFIRVDEDKELLKKIFRFRCQILCDELRIFDRKNYTNGLEIDRYDKYSIQYVALNEKIEISATVRLIHHSPIGYPTENSMKIDDNIKNSFDRNHLGEISRIFIAKKYRNFKDTKYIVESFKKFLYSDMKKNDIRYSYGALEKSFFRLLKIYKMRYEIIGELQEYGGKRYPCILYTSTLEKDNPHLLKEKNAF